MSYLILILINFFLWGASYIFLQPYLRRFNKQTVRHAFFILATLSIASYELVTFLNKESDFFEAGIEQLKTVKYVSDKVGDFQSYTYDPRQFKQNDNRTIFDVELKGNGNFLSVTCLMKKVNGAWILKEVEGNKLVKESNE